MKKLTVEIIHPRTGRATRHELPLDNTMEEAERAMEYNVSLTRGTVEGDSNQSRLFAIRKLMEIRNEIR